MDPAPSLAERKTELLAGVDCALWGPCIDDAKLADALAAIDAAGDAGRVAPPPDLIFEPLRYGGPADVSVVILGQDPYAQPGAAQGLCFSTRGVIPESLKRIFGCLERGGLCGPAARGCGDLRPWAVQGVLMINTAWTTRAGARRAHAAKWKPFTAEFVRRLCAERERAGARLHFMLWGDDARAYARVAARHGHAAHEYSHPSPLRDNTLPEGARFRMCPHFEAVNAAREADGRRPIAWDNLATVVAFSDGTSDLAGKKGVVATLASRAGFAAVVAGAQFGATVIRGEVFPSLYEFVDDGAPERGIRETDALTPPTNNRGELMGIIYCFLALLRGRALGRVEVVSDSKVSVLTLLEYLPGRLKKGTERELKNYDLLAIAWRLLGLLREQAVEVVLTHVRSHQRPPPASAPPRERFLHKGNHEADLHAAKSLAGARAFAVEVLGAPAVLAGLARAPAEFVDMPAGGP